MPAVSPLTIGLVDFLGRERQAAAQGAMATGGQGEKLIAAMLAAASRQNMATDPITMAVLNHLLGAANTEEAQKRADALKMQSLKDLGVTAAVGQVAQMVKEGKGKGFDTTTGSGFAAAVNAAAAKNKVSPYDILVAQHPQFIQMYQNALGMDKEGFLTRWFRKIVPSGVENALIGPEPPGLGQVFAPPASAATGGGTAARALGGVVRDAAYYQQHLDEFRALPKAAQQAIVGQAKQ